MLNPKTLHYRCAAMLPAMCLLLLSSPAHAGAKATLSVTDAEKAALWRAPDDCRAETKRHLDADGIRFSWKAAAGDKEKRFALSQFRRFSPGPFIAVEIPLWASQGRRLDLACVLSFGNLDAESRFTLLGTGQWQTITLTLDSFEGLRDAMASDPHMPLTGLAMLCVPEGRSDGEFHMGDLTFLPQDDMLTLHRLADHDCVTLRRGDLMRGELSPRQFELVTTLGRLVFPPESVIGAVTGSSTAVSLAMVDGQVFRGALMEKNLSLRMTIGEMMNTRLSRINDFSYKLSPDKPIFQSPQSPYFVASGSRVIFVPEKDLTFKFQSPHGQLTIPFGKIVEMSRDAKLGNQWMVTLTNGSRLVVAMQLERFEPLIAPTGKEPMAISLPASTIERIVNPGPIVKPLASLELNLIDGSIIYARPVKGALTIKMPTGAVDLPYENVVSIDMDPIDIGRATVTLWGGRRMIGRVLDNEIAMDIQPLGLTINVLSSQIASINMAGSLDTPRFEAKVRMLARNLQSPDAELASSAYVALQRIGPQARGVLQEMVAEVAPAAAEKLRNLINAYNVDN